MAVVHAQFETIHPLFDANGRVGRILLPLMLAGEGYPPVYLAGLGILKTTRGSIRMLWQASNFKASGPIGSNSLRVVSSLQFRSQ